MDNKTAKKNIFQAYGYKKEDTSKVATLINVEAVSLQEAEKQVEGYVLTRKLHQRTNF